MQDKGEKGWRKKIHAAARPKTPLQPPLAAPDDNSSERRRRASNKPDKPDKMGWRKTIHGTRPSTPSGASAAAKPLPMDQDGEDTRSDDHGSETSVSTPRRRSAPKPTFSRFMSGYLSLTTAPKDPIFAEPWSDDAPTVFIPPIEPMAALQAIHSHLMNYYGKPISAQHHSGLLRVFEDYRNLRAKMEKMEKLLKDIVEGYQSAENSWNTTEDSYLAEIRRLELLIARDTSGMTGLMAARKGTVVRSSRPQRKTIPEDRMRTAYEYLSTRELDEQIKLRSQKVTLHRPCSPSAKMTALSRHLSSGGSSEQDMVIGTPPNFHHTSTLSRKVKSELDLAKLQNVVVSNSFAQSDYSVFFESGDPLPDEVDATSATLLDTGIECEVSVALRELSTLVARRRGINVEVFTNKLMLLFSESEEDDDRVVSEVFDKGEDTASASSRGEKSGWSPNRRLQHFQSQPQLRSDQKRRRHFSFEPGDDQVEALQKDIDLHQTRIDSQKAPLSKLQGASFHQESESSQSPHHTLNTEVCKPSKIPSPLQPSFFGSVRRENSVSSSQTMLTRPHLDDRRDSTSSIVTAIRDPSLLHQSASRSSSIHNLRQAESTPKEQAGSPKVRNNAIALAAARAADGTSNRTKRVSPASSKTGATHALARGRPESDAPEKR
ncbi:hypothetical protein K504DRAFT_390462 [Pleomassaria siparia CBS 279.74]|uniref:Uncharacterized protein n=1 Tax=Pleomassaria siparia CBS 279.74 TaxID=1314801 RepID=A0A6G1JVE6_9PLEO|nr:hypothetical protein K504DRAFT_390462 [Pleomassaria siparia CBS 279.74]